MRIKLSDSSALKLWCAYCEHYRLGNTYRTKLAKFILQHTYPRGNHEA